MATKINIDYVRNFINENSECILLSEYYINAKSKLKLKCKCGKEFEVNFNKFKSQNQRQCQECGKELLMLQKRVPYEFVKQQIENRGAFLISNTYKSNNIPLDIKCKCGKIFKRCYSNIQQSKGEILCRSCISKNNNLLDYNYIKEYVDNNTNCQLISKEYIDCRKSLTFKCSCGKVFKVNWNNFYSSNQRLCSICSKARSKGEIRISEILNELNVKFIMEYRFDDCKYKRKLPFDFYIPHLNLVIEYDGEFHFENKFNNYEIQHFRDNIKNEFCINNNIKLARIKHTEFDNLYTIIKDIIANTEVNN